MKPLVGLEDIQGLDAIGWWPLATGWWMLLGLIAVVMITMLALHLRRQTRLRSWRHSVLKMLEDMDRTLNAGNAQAAALQLSTLVRRLAIQRFSRQECAGLEGREWLGWLSQKDPVKFNWLESSRCLIEAPFTRQDAAFEPQDVKKTIKAAKGWVQ